MKDVVVRGNGFQVDAVVSLSKEEFVSQNIGRTFFDIPREQHEALLGEVYDKCQQEKAKASVNEASTAGHTEQMPDEPTVDNKSKNKQQQKGNTKGADDEASAAIK